MSSGEEYCLYEVKPGDSLSAIAAHFGHITPTQLARINRLSVTGCGLPPVFPGQKILIPTVAAGRVVAPRIRRAPGSALRVASSSIDSSLLTYRQNAPLQRSQSDSANFKEDREKKFVKLQVERMLPSGDFIDGILIITPDCLCFDVSHPCVPFRICSVCFTTESVQQLPDVFDPAETTASLNLYLPLERLRSMSTLKSFTQRDSLCSRCRLLSITNGRRQPQSDERDTDDNGSSSKSSCPTVVNFAAENSDTTAAETTVEPYTVVESATNLESPSEFIDLTRSPSPTNTQVAAQSDEIVLHSSKTLSAANSLLLQLTEFVSPNETPKQYCFLISVEEISAVFAFLLNLGVESTQSQESIRFSEPSPSNKRKKSTSSSDYDSIVVHRNLIEEALEDLENVSFIPAIYGGESGILSRDMLVELSINFPTHWIGANMRLIYRADQDGYSLGSMYRKSKDVEDGVILLIRDTMNTVFGAILSERPHCSQHFYGTGETCVFHWSPNFKRYDWTKKNYFFMLGSANSFQIGGQSGRNAIWIDEALKYGRSEPTDTFDNPVLSGCLPSLRIVSHEEKQALSLLETTRNANEFHGAYSHNDYCFSGGLHSPGLESVPFVIDTLEIWELVS